MKILLINTNPVVSRLTALSARKEGISLDEVDNILEVKDINSYNIVFVDSDINSKEIVEFLKKSNVKRRVIFATQDQRDIDDIYNFTILKPFLPSEVSSILREAKADMDSSFDDDLELDSNIFKKIESNEDTSSNEEYMDLSKLISTKNSDINSELDSPKEKIVESYNSKDKDSNKLDLNTNVDLFSEDKDNLSTSNSNLKGILEPEDSKEKEINAENELFSIDKDSTIEVNPNDLNESSTKKDIKIDEPKVLDRDEISNIQSLLDGAVEESRKDLGLDGITIESSKSDSDIIRENKEEKVKSSSVDIKKRKERVLKDTVGSLPIEELRQLLRGTKIHITIEFPKEV
jgi:hypothetical protein